MAQDLSTDYAKKIELNWRNLGKIKQTILFLGRQNIPFRGQDEIKGSINRGNFLDLNLRALDNPEIAQHLKETFSYAASQIQNEINCLCGSRIQRAIIEDVRKSGFYGFICDETSVTTDISRQEQLS